jgi:hypothetical protein
MHYAEVRFHALYSNLSTNYYNIAIVSQALARLLMHRTCIRVALIAYIRLLYCELRHIKYCEPVLSVC